MTQEKLQSFSECPPEKVLLSGLFMGCICVNYLYALHPTPQYSSLLCVKQGI